MHLLSLHISFLGWLYQIHTAFQTLPHQLLLLRNTRRLKMEIQAAHAPPYLPELLNGLYFFKGR